MTETEWLRASDPTPMLEFLDGKASDRKCRLFLCACYHRVSRVNESINTTLALAERFADGLATDAERQATLGTLGDTCSGGWLPEAYLIMSSTAIQVLKVGAGGAAGLVGSAAAPGSIMDRDMTAWRSVVEVERTAQTSSLRDIFGNPFAPFALNPSWRTSTTVLLSRQMYDTRDFSLMPILADALQDAGCDNDDILNHCRGPGHHVRGCFVVDLLLNRE